MIRPSAVSRPNTARIRWNEASGLLSHAVSAPRIDEARPSRLGRDERVFFAAPASVAAVLLSELRGIALLTPPGRSGS
ncbi:hypothetical protein GCM10022247_58570 [Allokutzneria multivorans]|uniref:Uncharacterized protein n=1 Tax=Allokutzneria multivorans TaxID=1142134 RepID=A0ABP7THF1_9PSEU